MRQYDDTGNGDARVPTAGGRVLIVEQDRSLRDLLGMVLGMEQYEVESASHSQEALTALQRQRPALLLLGSPPSDPDNDVLLTHCQRSVWTSIPVLVLMDTPARWTGGSAATVLEKPFDLAELLGCIQRLTVGSPRLAPHDPD